MKKLLFFAFLFIFLVLRQEEHAWIFFKDKPNVQQALENPSTILSAKAIERKSLRGTPIDERDIPVNEEYISIVKILKASRLKPNLNGLIVFMLLVQFRIFQNFPLWTLFLK